MAEQTFNQIFDGYWRESNKGGLPEKSGVYCVYDCKYNILTKKVTLNKLIYIGESENVNQRIANHEKLKDWEKKLSENSELCYSFSPVDLDSITRVEAALINFHKPICNTQYLENFPFDKTTVKTSEKNKFLSGIFTIERS